VRAAIWIGVLVAAFVLAWQIQDRWAEGRRAERDAAYARAGASGEDLPGGFGRVVVGAPSGAPAIEGQRPPAGPPRPREGTGPAKPGPAPAPGAQAAFDRLRRHVVRRGDSISEICTQFYGTAREDVVEAVARVNGLSNPGAIREGQELVLPPLDELGGSRR
jgi:nucleoid-associated protein YgaU